MNLDYLYIGLLKSGELGFTEIPQEETNYRRIEMGPMDWFYLDENTKDIITNAVEIEFPNVKGLWGTITHFGIFDSLHDGNFLIDGRLENREFINTGYTIKFNIGSIEIPLEILKKLKIDGD